MPYGNSILNSINKKRELGNPMLLQEVREAICTLKTEKPPGIDTVQEAKFGYIDPSCTEDSTHPFLTPFFMH